MKATHIIQVSSYYPPHLGGQENAVQDLAAQLAKAGHQVQVVASTAGGGPSGVHKEQGILVKRLRGFVFGHAPIMPGFFATLFRVSNPRSIVHVHIGQAFTPEIVWLASKLRGFKYIAELHIDFEPSSRVGILLPLYKRFVLAPVLRSAAAVITLNDKTLHTVRNKYGCTNKTVIMNNGIDEKYFRLQRPALPSRPPRTLRLLFVGRLSGQKNVTALLKALTLTERKVHLDIIGEGEKYELIQQLIADYKLTNVTLHGRLPRERILSFYKTCNALIMPSLYEAQPLVLLEAMAARIPIIGTNVIGVADHIKDGGIIVEPTPQGLAKGIEHYFTHYALLPDMIDRATSLIESFRWTHTLKKYEALYEKILEA